MKYSVKPGLLKLFALSAGLLGLLLRLVLYTTGMDDKGLLVAGHWAGTAEWVLTGLVLAAVFGLTRLFQGFGASRYDYPTSSFAGLGCIALAAALMLSNLREIASPPDSTMTLVRWILGFLSVISLICIFICRITGNKPFFLFHGILCVYFAIRMVSQYQQWSSDPQIQDYAFCLCAYVALMLTSYQLAAFDADMGSHRALWLMGLVAVYLCCLGLQCNADAPLLLAAGFWALTNVTRHKDRRPLPPQEEV